MEHTFIILFAIATAVAIAVSRTRVPYTVALVAVGLAVGSLRIVEPPHLTKDLLFSIFLPGLVFEAAYNMHTRELRESWGTVAALAGPGLLLAIALTALLTVWPLHALGLARDFTWTDGVVFASLVSATDPIAVVSLFRKLGVAPRLTTLVEAESLFNDGTSIVALTLVLAYVDGESTSALALAGRFVLVVCGGGVVGGIIAYVIIRITRHIDDPMIEITLTTIAAYGSFVVAEDLGLSGVIATVVAGMVFGTIARESAFSIDTRTTADVFWRYLAFALNSIVFLLIGFAVRPTMLIAAAGIIAVAYVAVLAARAGVVYGVAAAFGRTRERIPARWAALVTWGGLRGALAMVLALALPASFDHRELLVDMTFGVVVVSLLLQGLTMPAAATRLAR
ncbi:MAG TPA: sodium:proton antiporter [Gemmatimonadaceae bacterium]|nr:sodium:proton antiporter [Gemmatimonadaceae bacterium]